MNPNCYNTCTPIRKAKLIFVFLLVGYSGLSKSFLFNKPGVLPPEI